MPFLGLVEAGEQVALEVIAVFHVSQALSQVIISAIVWINVDAALPDWHAQ